jgi:hypothetical protein
VTDAEFDPIDNPVRRTSCGGCPWVRDSPNGWLGPFTAEEWVGLAASDAPVACHESIEVNDSWEGALQCAGPTLGSDLVILT